jgi:tetratricopeptide (TPR) repeat protein
VSTLVSGFEETMPEEGLSTARTRTLEAQRRKLLGLLKRRYEALDQLRRGVCLLNAGQYELAEAAFRRALDGAHADDALPSYLAASLSGQGKKAAAAACLAEAIAHGEDGPVVRIRHAHALFKAGKPEEAVLTLREGIRLDPQCAESHFQLGVLLASLEQYEEAELRFTQSVNIDHEHTDALVNLALCCGARKAPDEAHAHLRRAQAQRPHDARIALLLSQAAKAARSEGYCLRLRVEMPECDRADDSRGIEELSRVIEADPDFVDAFLSIPLGEVDEQVFAMLLKTLETALERQPEQAELHYHCGRVLARLGRCEDAISRNERAVAIEPTFVRALIELGKLYKQTDRSADAATRLEQAIAAGAEFAGVYFMLGNLYRDQGLVTNARNAYRRALVLNNRYEAAQKALQALPAA